MLPLRQCLSMCPFLRGVVGGNHVVCSELKQVMCGALSSHISVEDNFTHAYIVDGLKSRVYM